MKIINFTAVEILPSLLDKSKTQTMRPTFGDFNEKFTGTDIEFMKKYGDSFSYKPKTNKMIAKNKPPKFKVGEKVKLVWGGSYTGLFKLSKDKTKFLNRDLGTVEITKVFKIEIYKEKATGLGFDVHYLKGDSFGGHKDLAKKDGFKSAEAMFKWFDKKYDLSEPKEFWVYGWRWFK